MSFTHCGNKSILRVLRIILVILPEHPSETIVFHNEDGNPARANIKQALGYLKDGDGDGNSQPHKGVQASASSDVMYSFTSAQDGDPLQDDVRLCLGDDLKKAQDHSQRQAVDICLTSSPPAMTKSFDLSSEAKSRPEAVTILYRVLDNLAASSEALCVTEQEIAKLLELPGKESRGEDLHGLLTTLRSFISLIPKENFKNMLDLHISLCKEMVE
ncbi:hypothetical protein Tco_1193338 [Tanacetum coccineum]